MPSSWGDGANAVCSGPSTSLLVPGRCRLVLVTVLVMLETVVPVFEFDELRARPSGPVFLKKSASSEVFVLLTLLI